MCPPWARTLEWNLFASFTTFNPKSANNHSFLAKNRNFYWKSVVFSKIHGFRKNRSFRAKNRSFQAKNLQFLWFFGCMKGFSNEKTNEARNQLLVQTSV